MSQQREQTQEHICEKIAEWRKDPWRHLFYIFKTEKGDWALLVPGQAMIEIWFCPVCGKKLE